MRLTWIYCRAILEHNKHNKLRGAIRHPGPVETNVTIIMLCSHEYCVRNESILCPLELFRGRESWNGRGMLLDTYFLISTHEGQFTELKATNEKPPTEFYVGYLSLHNKETRLDGFATSNAMLMCDYLCYTVH
jgi:hypothetical protein